jgi:hypothetical protein
MTSRGGLRISAGSLLVAGAVLLGHGMLAGAQNPPASPPGVPEDYVLLAVSKLNVSGPIGLATGSVGVNDTNGELTTTPIAPLALNTQDGRHRGQQGAPGATLHVRGTLRQPLRCSVGTLPFTALQQRGRTLVYP